MICRVSQRGYPGMCLVTDKLNIYIIKCLLYCLQLYPVYVCLAWRWGRATLLIVLFDIV